MILVDTSIWIEYLKQNSNYIGEFEKLLENRNVVTVEPIFAELVYGCKNQKERDIINSYWKVLDKLKFGHGTFIAAAEYANNNNFINYGIGLIDSILIKATIENNCLIWTLDKKILNTIQNKYLYK